MRKMFASLMIFVMFFSIFPFTITPVMAGYNGSEADAISYPLYAGQTILIGEVLVWNDDTTLYVKYVINVTTDDWYITEIHIDIGTSCAPGGGIPQTLPNKQGKGGGNPIPGQFEIADFFNPPTHETDPYTFDLEANDLNLGDSVCIAAHAVIQNSNCHHQQQTAWGGVEEFSGANWATCIEYELQGVPV